LGAALARTKTIELGTGLTCPIIRYHPSIIAQAAATVAEMSDERFYLCVGTGEALNEYSAVGLWPGYNERQDMMREAIELMRLLWSGEETSFDGEYYTTKKAKLFTLPKKQVPIYISTLVPASAYFAGYYGDGLITVGGLGDKIYKDILKEFERGAREAKKDPKTMPRLLELNAAYTEDENDAIDIIQRFWAGTFIPAMFDQKIYTAAGSAQNGAVVRADIIKEKSMISKSPKDHIDYIKHHEALGFTHLYMHLVASDEKTMLQRYGKDILPKLHK
jgi:coenzyme F420-dependent glucose-6-phosphate dehydrogenase